MTDNNCFQIRQNYYFEYSCTVIDVYFALPADLGLLQLSSLEVTLCLVYYSPLFAINHTILLSIQMAQQNNVPDKLQPTMEQIGHLLHHVNSAGPNQQRANQQIEICINQHFVT